ncbi:MAG: trypsin-like peptidase domain-containing protein [Planctomycetota bacterium]
MKRIRFSLATVLVVGSLTALCASQESIGEAGERADFREIVEAATAKVFPAVAYIKCVRESLEGGKKESQEVSGSGVIISRGGEVLTNWHVIEKAQRVRCLLSDGRHAEAEIVGSDQDTDLALLRLRSEEPLPALPFAVIGDSTVLKEGDFVMAMGAPWGLNRSVSIGIISCTRRFLDTVSEYSLWLQTDAAINPGNSGGPLVNTAGEVVGVNARGMNFSEGMGFAIPSDTIAILLPQLREHGRVRWSWTGLQLQPLRDFNRDMYFDATEGVIVAGTDPGSPARLAGFTAKDRIVSVNGHPLTAVTEEDLPAVRRWLALQPTGESLSFAVMRGEQALELSLVPREKGDVEGKELALERLDFSIKEINQFDNPDLYFHRQTGVFVFGVKSPGNADNAGLRPRDILLKIDDTPVESLQQVREVHKRLLANLASNHRVLVVVLRGGLMRQIVLDFGRDYSRQ